MPVGFVTRVTVLPIQPLPSHVSSVMAPCSQPSQLSNTVRFPTAVGAKFLIITVVFGKCISSRISPCPSQGSHFKRPPCQSIPRLACPGSCYFSTFLFCQDVHICIWTAPTSLLSRSRWTPPRLLCAPIPSLFVCISWSFLGSIAGP